jgi:superfamily II DNA or RNA helicase
MGLESLSKVLKRSYRTGRDQVVPDFYIPCFKQSVRYDRAVGYFTSASLSLAARGVVHMVIQNKGKMRLVASPDLTEGDIASLRNSDADMVELFKRIAGRSMNDLVSKVEADCMSALAWMVSEGMLEIRLAYPKSGRGIFHEKIGVFHDGKCAVAFTGSINETAGGLVNNHESIDCYGSWIEPDRTNDKVQEFDDLWEGRLPQLNVIDFTKASDELFKRYKGTQNVPVWQGEGFDPETFGVAAPWLARRLKLPSENFQIRPYQRAAVSAWRENKGRGILAMATGTGKTKTALMIAQHVSSADKKNDRLWIVVICPYVNLCQQWEDEIVNWGVVPIGCHGNSDDWSPQLESALAGLRDMVVDVVVSCVTNDSFRSDSFQSIVTRFRSVRLFIIGDEVHNLGAEKMQVALPDSAQLRLGLSATPVRAHDEDGTLFLERYFGDTVFEFPLSRAIAEGYLTHYDYFPVRIKLTEEEAEQYAVITKKLAKCAFGGDSEMSDAVQTLLVERARITGAAANKIAMLQDLVAASKPKAALFYCSDGTTDSDGHAHEGKQLTNVVKVLGESGLKVSPFTSKESTVVRESLLRSIRSGVLDGLVAIRCLDEGIDVPSLSTAYILASSTNPRQSIQRRGRILRTSKETGKTKAVIYDFFVEPPPFGDRFGPSGRKWERSLFSRELRRILEFCACADNGSSERTKLLDLRQEYDLMDL